MKFYQRLPRNRREFALFLAVVSILSVNLIAPLITCFELGFSLAVWQDCLRVLPLLWLCVIAMVLLTYRPAEWLTQCITEPGDSFGASVTVNILCTVLLMSIFLTVFGTWIGSRRISLEPIRLFFFKWPRNFALSFAVEALVAQPVARAVMALLHRRLDAKRTD